MTTPTKRLAILRANRLLVNSSEFLIAAPGLGASREITEYALRRQLRGIIQVTLLTPP